MNGNQIVCQDQDVPDGLRSDGKCAARELPSKVGCWVLTAAKQRLAGGDALKNEFNKAATARIAKARTVWTIRSM